MSDTSKILKTLKAVTFERVAVSFYILKRKLIQKEANYEIFYIDIDEKIKKKLVHIAKEKISHSNNIIDYDFNTADNDDDLLLLPAADTDFDEILKKIYGNRRIQQISQYEELLDSWLYLVRFDWHKSEPLFFARKVSKSWPTKKTVSLTNVLFKDSMLVDIGNQEIFRIDNKLDFFVYDKNIFIINKKEFESAMNFRLGMEKNRDLIVVDFKERGIFEDPDIISTLVGNNMRRLRKLSQVKKAGYYSDKNFLSNLKKVAKEEAWEIIYSDDGKILVDENNIETVLRLLNNDRLTSKVNDESFDVDVKRRL